MTHMIPVLDFGSQTAQLIVRRLREIGVYSELIPFDAPQSEIFKHDVIGIVLSGGPASVYDEGAPALPTWLIDSPVPVLGICYGMQLQSYALGGTVVRAAQREYGNATIDLHTEHPLFAGMSATQQVWMSHGDHIESIPDGFVPLASNASTPFAAMASASRRWYGIQFHPEVVHTPNGRDVLRHFALDICNATPSWRASSFVTESIARIKAQVGDGKVICGLSGGVDSAVAALLIHRAIGENLTCVFVDNGLLRLNEADQVVHTFRDQMGIKLIHVDASAEFLGALADVSDPEHKRKIIGEKFVRVFEREANKIDGATFLAQGTLYPDVIESKAPDRQKGVTIKTHHNVGGLPADMKLTLVEPLRYLFKDEVRAAGMELGLAEDWVWRHPFPGPGLAVRILGAVSQARADILREADYIFISELRAAGLYRSTQQAFAVLLPVQSVGVMGDGRTYADVIALRAITTEDYMTADWAHLPYEFLAKVSNRIVNEVAGVNRVVYDISSKPPATIEWE